jgi:hypothetical protein
MGAKLLPGPSSFYYRKINTTMIYGVEFHFFSPSRAHLGISFLQGILHEEEADYSYQEVNLGFLFFFIEITAKKRVD